MATQDFKTLTDCPYSETRVDTPAISEFTPSESEKLKQLRDLVLAVNASEKRKAFCDDYCLARYLRARKSDVDAAKEMLLATLEWRDTYKPENLTEENVKVQKLAGSNYHHGVDKHGHPVIYMRAGRDPPGSVEDKLALIVYMMEKAIKSADNSKGVEKITYVIDLKNFSMTGPGADPKLAKAWINIFQNHYPERSHRVYVLNAPMFFSALWKVISIFIDPVTYKKMKFVNGAPTPSNMEEVAEEFTAELMEEPYGILPQIITDADSKVYIESLMKPSSQQGGIFGGITSLTRYGSTKKG